MPEGKEMYVTARVLGTFGYFDPEYTSVRKKQHQLFSFFVNSSNPISILCVYNYKVLLTI